MLDSASFNPKKINESVLVAMKDKIICIKSSHNCAWNISIEQNSRYVEWTDQKIANWLTNSTEGWRCECCQNSCGWKNAQIKCSNQSHANLTYEMILASNCNVTGGSNTNNIACGRTDGTLEENLHGEHNNNRYITLHAKLPAHAAGSGSLLSGPSLGR